MILHGTDVRVMPLCRAPTHRVTCGWRLLVPNNQVTDFVAIAVWTRGHTQTMTGTSPRSFAITHGARSTLDSMSVTSSDLISHQWWCHLVPPSWKPVCLTGTARNRRLPILWDESMGYSFPLARTPMIFHRTSPSWRALPSRMGLCRMTPTSRTWPTGSSPGGRSSPGTSQCGLAT